MHYSNAMTFFYCLLHASIVATLSQENIQELLITHNFYRRLRASVTPPYTVSNMNMLVWDNRLEYEAAQSVSCTSWRNQVDFDARRSYNVGRGRREEGVLTHIARRWYQQGSMFIPEDKACLPYGSCNKFRNMVNAQHRRMGCAAAMQCGRNYSNLVLLCIYEGGSPEEFGFQYGPSCTGCVQPSSYCRFNLCVPCTVNRRQCGCPKTCNKPGVGYGVLNRDDCTCSCTYGHGPNCDQRCQNVEQFEDFDVCSLVSRDSCDDAVNGQHYRELCPAVCSCRPLPSNETLRR